MEVLERLRKPLLYPTELRGRGLNLAYSRLDWERRLTRIIHESP